MRISDWSSDVCSSDLHRRAQKGVMALADSRRDFGAESAGLACFMDDQHAAGPGDDFGDGRIVDRREPAEIQHRHVQRSEEHTSELQSLTRISYAVFCLKKKKKHKNHTTKHQKK